jgi:hypothetical protein
VLTRPAIKEARSAMTAATGKSALIIGASRGLGYAPAAEYSKI